MDVARTAMIRHRTAWILALFAVELVVLAGIYQFTVTLECHETGFNLMCRGLRSLAARAFSVIAVISLMVWAWPEAMRQFRAAAAEATGTRPWAWVHAAGIAILLLPALAFGGDLNTAFGMVAAILLPGAAAAAVGGAFWMAPVRAWAGLLAHDRGKPLVLLGVAALIPDLANLVLPLWDSPLLTRMTFEAVRAFLSLSTDQVISDPEAYVIGLKEFRVHIARQCSGVEGVALVTGFVVIYGALFRQDLRLWRYALTVLPLAISASWALNVVRIGVLIQLGAHVSPDLAVNGFHSYAGWLFFTFLAFGVIWAVHAMGWLHKAKRAQADLPLSRDLSAALTLPLAVMLIVTVLQHALFPHPELGYPIKAIAMLAALPFFWRVFLAMDWRIDRVAVLAGAGVGVGWLALDLTGGGDDVLQGLLAEMTQASLISWVAFRLVGTVLMVPLIEEAFFRGFLLARFVGGGVGGRLVAVVASSLLFGLLHGRWIVGTLAGVVFALVYLRRQSLPDAVIAHVVANLIVALAALYTQDWARI